MTSVAAWLLTACGVALVLIGTFFVAVRPPLLPEDARYMGSSAESIVAAIPTLTMWLRRVFWVLGGYAVSAGSLVMYVANTGVRTGDAGALILLTVAGVTSIGWMSVVNFIIVSKFRWALVGLDGMWALGLLMAVTAR